MKNQKQTETKTKTKNQNDQNPADSKMLRNYKKVAYSTPNLKRQEEFELLKKIKENDCQESRQIILNSYLRTVISLAKKYCNNNHLSLEDAVQAGITGVFNALEKFDIAQYKKVDEKGSSMFAYFCYRAIIMELDIYYRENIRQFGVSSTTNTNLTKINKIYKSGGFNNIFDPDEMAKIVSEKLKLKHSDSKRLLDLFHPAISLDQEVESDSSHGDSDYSYKDFLLKSYDEQSPREITMKKEILEKLVEKINTLPFQDRNMINCRYGINCTEHTLDQVAKKHNMSAPIARLKLMKIEKTLKNLLVLENI